MNRPSDRIWAYLHNEMNEAEKEAFLQALNEDPKLNDRFRNCSKTHQEIQDVLPTLENEEPLESIEKKLLAEWEADHPEHAETAPCRTGRRILTFALPPAAAAAALAVLLSLSAGNTPIHWQKTGYGAAPQRRGQAAGIPHYSRDELKQVDRILRHSIETAYGRLTESPAPWELQIRLQEVAGGALLAEISGQPHAESGEIRTWTDSFPGAPVVRERAEVLAERIAEDLAEQAK
jgi:hypothetical protein